MVTKCRVEKILNLVKKEYDYMDNKPIYISIKKRENWGAETTAYDYTLKLGKEFDDNDFTDFFYEYLAEEFNFDLTWAEVDYETTATALVLLHEIGHIQQTMNMVVDRRYVETMNNAYDIFRTKAMFLNRLGRTIEYRKISYEYLADKFAVDMFNKYAIKILAILNGTTQKEIKNRLAEVKKEVA